MTTKDFNKQFISICNKHGYTKTAEYDGQVKFVGDTPFGKIQVFASPSPKIGLYTVFFRFLEKFEIEDFYRYFNRHENINRFSKKWNIHFSDAEHTLNVVDERLDNLNYILKRDGKVLTEDYKAIL